MTHEEAFKELYDLLKNAHDEKKIPASLEIHFANIPGYDEKPYYTANIFADDLTPCFEIEKEERLERLLAWARRQLDVLADEETKRPVSVEEKAAKFYGVTVRELTLGQLEDYKKENGYG